MASPADAIAYAASGGWDPATIMQVSYYLRTGQAPDGLTPQAQQAITDIGSMGLSSLGVSQLDYYLSNGQPPPDLSYVDESAQVLGTPADNPAPPQDSATAPIAPPAPGAPPPPTVNTANLSARSIIDSTLAEFGLQSLGDQLWQQYLSGVPIEAVVSNIRNTPEYAARFPAMKALADKGRAISEAQYIDYERTAAQLFKSAGLPPGFYDSPDDFSKLIANDVSPVELAHRINDGYLRVAQAPKEVRDAYAQWFGASGDAALAASFLDPDTAATVLDKHLAEAQLHGFGNIAGFDISQDDAARATDFTTDPNQLQSAVGKLSQFRPLLNETVGEGTAGAPNITTGTGLNAILGNDAAAQDALARREQERQALFGGSGGVSYGSKGSTLGSAQ